MTCEAVDLFAGVGWDHAAHELGLDPLGIELDADACATREACGMRTLQADVAALDPHDFAPCALLIASPPCQAWSMAGKRRGAADQERVTRCAMDLAAGRDSRATHRAECADERSILVVEPLRWAFALTPDLIALEQVPPVLGLWSLFAQILAARGYSTWAGVLEAERYGVPQTRERAILMASRIGQVHPPAPTHQRFVSGEPARAEHTFDGELLPWASMADALGWGMVERPSVTVLGASSSGGREGIDGGSGSRAIVERERERESLDRSVSRSGATATSQTPARGR